MQDVDIWDILFGDCTRGQANSGRLVVSLHGELFQPPLMKLKCDFEEKKSSCSFPGWVPLLQAPKSMYGLLFNQNHVLCALDTTDCS